MPNGTTVLRPGNDGGYSLTGVVRSNIQRIDISDVDLLITMKNGDHYLLPNGGIAAMGNHPPVISFQDGSVSAADLIGEVGVALNLATAVPMPSSFKIAGAKEGEDSKAQKLSKIIHKLQQQNHHQQQSLQQQSKQIIEQQKQIEQQKNKDACASDNNDQVQHNNAQDPCAPHKSDNSQVAPLNINTSTSIEQMVQNLQKIQQQLHAKDYDYSAPPRYEVPTPPPSAPLGVPPPISLTPIVTLFMGNVVGTTVSTTANPGYTTYYGGGGQANSNAAADIGPRDALQWSAATITGDNGNDVIYAEGPLVGNTNPAVSNSTYYTKQFLLNVAGYFTTLSDITIKGVPAGVSIGGAANEGGGVWSLPSSSVLQQIPFTITYQNSNYNPAGSNLFTIEFDVSGMTTRHSLFNSVQTVEFEYVNVTNSNQITNPTLVYDDGGYTKEIYVLPTLDQPNIITAGDGNDFVYGSRSNDTITLGNGSDTVTDGNGNNTITIGNGINTIISGNGNNAITVGTGTDTITLGNGTNTIIAGGGGGSLSVGFGSNTITVNSNGGSTNNYTITAAAGANITGGDDNYAITTGVGADTISLGAGNDTITTAGGGGSISLGSGDQTIQINSTRGSTNNYQLMTTGNGTTAITAGDDNYTIFAAATGASTISIGNGTSTVTATAGASLASVTTGNGNMTVAIGAGNGDNATIGNNASIANTIAVSLGNGAGDSITTNGSSASTGTIAIGSGNNDVIHADSGSYTITVGGASGTTNTLSLNSGSNDSVTAGNGNNTIYAGSHALGTDTFTLGNGNNLFYVGTGSDTITAGTGNNTLHFDNLASALAILFGTTATSSATGANVSDSFTGFNTIYGTNSGDSITLNTGNLIVYAGSGNDQITLGSGTDTIYAGNGNNTITGTSLTTATGDLLYGGTGNNIYNAPDAGTTYNGTNGAALTAMINNLAYTFSDPSTSDPFANATGVPNSITHAYSGGVATINLYLQNQINELNYASNSNSALTINLAVGAGTGGNAAGSHYAFTPVAGYSTINEAIANNGADTLTPSYDDTLLVGGSGGDYFQDGNTLASQTVMLVGNGNPAGGGFDFFETGPAHEIIVANPLTYNYLNYGDGSGGLATAANSAGIVLNFDDVSHTFNNSLFTAPLSIAAYTGASWGAVTPALGYGLNVGTSSLSWSAGDYFVPVNGNATDITAILGSDLYTNLVYSGTNAVTYYAGDSHGDFFYAGSGGSQYQMGGGFAVADVLTPGGINIFITHNDAYDNTPYNIYVILNRALDTGSQSALDASANLTFGGTTYQGFAYGWGNVTTPVNNPLTYISGYENILGFTGNDYIVGDNNGNQINARAGSNTIILGDGTNIVTALEGSNNISSSSASGQTIGINTLNYESATDIYSGYLAGYSGGHDAAVEVFLNYSIASTQSGFFSSNNDQTTFWGSSALASAYEARVGAVSYSYDSVQPGIISTINGSDYSSGLANSSAATSASALFNFDNVYSGAQVVIAHAGNNIFVDNVGTNAQSFNGTTSASNVYYVTPAEVPYVTITAASSAQINILRVEGWGATTTPGNAFGASDPFTTTHISNITDLDVRSGTDVVNIANSTVTLGANSTANAHTPTYNLSAADIQNITGVSNTPTLTLKLDNGDIFTPTGTVSTVTAGNTISYYSSATHTAPFLIATDTHNAASYYSDTLVYNAANNAHLNIHYGTG